MSLIVKTVTGWLKRFILLFGVYVILYGHVTPGGGFAGGVIVACAFILLTLAEGQRSGLNTVSKSVAAGAGSVAALVFLGVALMGIRQYGFFFKNLTPPGPEPHVGALSGGSIEVCEIAIGFVVAGLLFVVFTVLAATHVFVKEGDRKMARRGGE